MKKLMTLIIVLFISVTTFARDKATENANKNIEKLNNALIAGNPEAKLTDIQKKDVLELLLATSKEVRNIQKTVTDKDEKQTQIKAAYAEQAKKINTVILTKEQVKARQLGNKKAK